MRGYPDQILCEQFTDTAKKKRCMKSAYPTSVETQGGGRIFKCGAGHWTTLPPSEEETP